jgi:Ca-activated chloride channel family protein
MRYRQAMHSTLDVLTFLAYAAMLGLCMGALLGAFALMLASQAHAAGDAAGSLLLHRPPSEAASAAPLVSTETVFRSDGPIRHVRIVQAYRNPFHERQEGLYVLRLPENATLERLAVSVRGVDDGEGDETGEASPDEAAPSHALLSAEEPGVVSRAIAGIEPGEMVLIELEYQQVVRYDRGRTALRLLTKAPERSLGIGRRRRSPTIGREPVPLGVEGAWLTTSGEPRAPWLWLVPVVALYALVAFLS